MMKKSGLGRGMAHFSYTTVVRIIEFHIICDKAISYVVRALVTWE